MATETSSPPEIKRRLHVPLQPPEIRRWHLPLLSPEGRHPQTVPSVKDEERDSYGRGHQARQVAGLFFIFRAVFPPATNLTLSERSDTESSNSDTKRGNMGSGFAAALLIALILMLTLACSGGDDPAPAPLTSSILPQTTIANEKVQGGPTVHRHHHPKPRSHRSWRPSPSGYLCYSQTEGRSCNWHKFPRLSFQGGTERNFDAPMNSALDQSP